MNTPILSVGMPVYNGEPFLRQALEAILSQDFTDFELIISDNCSTDDTQSICLEFAAIDQRISYHRNERNIGAARNYNKVFLLARGKYFKWATHDDICLPGHFRRCVTTIDKAPSSVVLVYPQSRFIDDQGEHLSEDADILETRHSKPYMRLSRILCHVSMANAIFGVIRCEALRKTRLIDSFIASDYVLLAELAMLGELWEVREPLYLRRIHHGASQYANTSNQAVQAWFDPSRRLTFTRFHTWFPTTSIRVRLLTEWIKSTQTIGISRYDSILCGLSVPVVYGYARFRCFAGNIKAHLLRPLGN
ncbi:glycosyltransferase family 2 protein [Parahaliea mediterranea]|uniref:Glycosyltransferase family 2 protein n=1 Tax=Parahaliea mediterranea TaxID=651086 RepID=A0A939DCW1_9GAMM|nr:glycosyltransferase [Parahaliea mediterranea]MBN7795252.1 glycosyltransferase family 2 protein [Parahaliea mediterranea]